MTNVAVTLPGAVPTFFPLNAFVFASISSLESEWPQCSLLGCREDGQVADEGQSPLPSFLPSVVQMQPTPGIKKKKRTDRCIRQLANILMQSPESPERVMPANLRPSAF